MRAASLARHLGSAHPIAEVVVEIHGAAGRRVPEAGPARSRLELGVRAEQLRPASRASVDARSVLVPVRAGECALRPLLPKHVELLGTEPGPPFLVGLGNLVLVVQGLLLSGSVV